MPLYPSPSAYQAAASPRLNVVVPEAGRVLGHSDFWPSDTEDRRWRDAAGDLWHVAFQRDEPASGFIRDDERGDLVATKMNPNSPNSRLGPVRVLVEDETFNDIDSALADHRSQGDLSWIEGRLAKARLLAP